MNDSNESNTPSQTDVVTMDNTLVEHAMTLDESAEGVEPSYSDGVKSIRELNLKLIDIAEANVGALFNFARQIASASGPSDIITSWNTHGRKQFDMLAAQTSELTALGHKFVSTTTAPIIHSVQHPFGHSS